MSETSSVPAATAPTPHALAVSRLHAADIPDCIALVRESFEALEADEAAVANWFDARILANPWQPQLDGIGVGVRDAGRLVAFRAMFAQPWWLQGQQAVMAFAAHTCIAPAYRGAGLGGELIARSREVALLTGSSSSGNITQKVYARQGFVAVGGKGNDFHRMRVGYRGSVQARVSGPAGRWLGRLADLALLRRGREAHDLELRPVARCGPEFDQLWLAARLGYPSCLERSSRYLNWRLFDQPTHPLNLAGLRDRAGRLRGYAVWHVQRYSAHVACAVLRDLFFAEADDAGRRGCLSLLLAQWREQGISWASLELAAPRLTRLFAELRAEPVPSHGNRYQVHARREVRDDSWRGWFRSGLDGDYFDTRPPAFDSTARPT